MTINIIVDAVLTSVWWTLIFAGACIVLGWLYESLFWFGCALAQKALMVGIATVTAKAVVDARRS